MFTSRGERGKDCQCNAYLSTASLLKRYLPDYEPWLLVGHTAWQPDNRVVRYKRIWGYLSDRGYPLPVDRPTEEYLVQSNEGIKFFSAARCEKVQPTELLKILRDELASTVVFLNENSAENDIQSVLQSGWTCRHPIPPQTIVAALCEKRMIACFIVGQFDDVECGFGAIGARDLMSPFLDGKLGSNK